MSLAGYTKDVRIRLTTGASTAFVTLPATSATLTLAGDALDDTDITSTGFRSRIIGLLDWNISAPSNFESTNTAFVNVRTAFFNRQNVDIQYLPDGTLGYEGTGWVETFSHSGDVGGLETVDITLVAESQLSTVLT